MGTQNSILDNDFANTLIRIKARQLCRRTDFSRSDYDDLQQDMRLYLLEKAHLFDPNRGNIESFITNTLKTWVAMRLRYQNREKRRDSHKAASLERTFVESDGCLTTLGAALLEEDGHRLTQTESISPMERFELRDALKHGLQTLEPDDRALLLEVAEHGITSTAKSRGTSWRQINNAMTRIRRHFEKVGLGSN
jgi:DNA-directed RNA polymerase specialized sigma24 family protein